MPQRDGRGREAKCVSSERCITAAANSFAAQLFATTQVLLSLSLTPPRHIIMAAANPYSRVSEPNALPLRGNVKHSNPATATPTLTQTLS
jgi:hypothetical protein